jgi:hypothetical protein
LAIGDPGSPALEARQMTDRLLEWISYRATGHVDDLPEELIPEKRPYRFLDDLAVLGHVEVDPDYRWRVAPPVLAAIGDESEGSTRAVLCGARTRGLMDRLTLACRSHGGVILITPQTKRPDCVLVAASSTSEICAIAAASALNWQRDAAFTLLATLPSIARWPRTPCQMVAGKVEEVHRFSKSKLLWAASSLEEAQQSVRGLFRIKRDWNSIVLLKEGRESQSEIDMAAGRLAVAAGVRKLHVDLKSRALRIPIALKPPTLVSRALALCSGMLPEVARETRELVFRGISSRIAPLAVSVLGLRVA